MKLQLQMVIYYSKDYSVVEDFKEFVFSELDKNIEFEDIVAEYNA